LEVKGVKGYDNRLYIYDLMRLSPRDLNYTEVEPVEGEERDGICDNMLIRNELVHNYIMWNKMTELHRTRQEE
jgi:hypothetical protein